MADAVRRLFIHAGPPKTGSSAVQHIFRTHDIPSVMYPKVGLWADGSHHNLMLNFYRDFNRPEVTQTDIHEMFEAIGADARRTSHNMLISSEGLVARDVGALIRALLPYLGGARWEPEILIVCREHFEICASSYNQRVKDAVVLERRGPDDFLAEDRFAYAPIVRKLRASGFPVTALNYHPAEDFVQRFLSHIGVSDARPIDNERRNISLSVKGLIATLAANNVAQTAADRHRCDSAIRRLRPFFAPSGFIFGREAAEAAELRFRDDRRFLSDEFGIELPSGDLAARQNGFFIDRRELEEIAAVTRDLGPEGSAIVAFASRYLRSEPGAEPPGARR